jgi:hypothetical protein
MKKFKLVLQVDVYAEDIEKIPAWYIQNRLNTILDSYSNNVYLHRNLTSCIEEVKE